MSDVDRRSPSDHLLRTLAAVPVSSEILDLGCGRGRHTEALLRLGFPVHACDPRPTAVRATREAVRDLVEQGSVNTMVQHAPLESMEYPDATFDWVVAVEAESYVSTDAELRTFFGEARRLLKPGGWLYVSLPAAREEQSGPSTEGSSARFTEEAIERQRMAADLAEARAPSQVESPSGAARVRALYRRVEPTTPV